MKYIVMVEKLNNMHYPGSLEYIERLIFARTNKLADRTYDKLPDSRLA